MIGGASASGGSGSALRRSSRWLPTRIRSKLIFLHTTFSLGLAVLLLLILQPALRELTSEADGAEARMALELDRLAPNSGDRRPMENVDVRVGSAGQIGLDTELAERVRGARGEVVPVQLAGGHFRGGRGAARWDEARSAFVVATAQNAAARAALNRLYLLLTIVLLAVYGLVALTIEVFVLPKHVYEPIETLRAADDAVQRGRGDEGLIPDPRIPADEFGEIMRSRNRTIVKLREQEVALATALQRVEAIATELKRKNHLLETARRNLADQDRLASLGMMSAGIAHELNTPLAVLKGCVEELCDAGAEGVPPAPAPGGRAALMRRTVGRLERLSESLLDFARARPAKAETVALRAVVDEAWTLVSLDRSAASAGGVDMRNDVDGGLIVLGDGDRLTQVMVNLLRNAVDAMDGGGMIRATADLSHREGREWVSLSVSDTGPGIDPSVLARLFEPFQSTKLDSHGAGLGLAVSEGIVREHGGVLLAKNAEGGGAVFEMMLPAPPGSGSGRAAAGSTSGGGPSGGLDEGSAP